MIEYCVNYHKTLDNKTKEWYHVVHKKDIVRGKLRHCLPKKRKNRPPLGKFSNVASAVNEAVKQGYLPARACKQCQTQK